MNSVASQHRFSPRVVLRGEPDKSPAWTTESEFDFLTNIGKSLSKDQSTKHTKAELLRGYLRAAPLRYDWGSVDKQAAIRYAKDLLDAELKQGATQWPQ